MTPLRRAARGTSAICASGCGCGGCTTSSTSAGCCSSRRSCRLRCGDRMSAGQAAGARPFPQHASSSLPAAGAARPARSARAGRAAGDARRRMDAVPRVRLAAAAQCQRAAIGPSAGCASTPCRRPRWSSRRAAAASHDRAPRSPTRSRPLRWSVSDRAARADQPADPDDRPASTSSAATSPSSTSPGGSPSAGCGCAIVTVDPVGALPADWRRTLAGLQRPRLACSTTSRSRSVASRPAIEVSRARRFIATTWWTAHIARDALRSVGRRSVPLPDPGVRAVHVPDGHLRRAGRPSPTRFPHFALFSSELLRATFAPTRIGVFARRRGSGRRALGGVPERDHGQSAPPPTAELAARDHAAAAVLRPPRAARRAQHVRARGAGARSRASRDGRPPGLGAERHRDGRARAARSRLGGGGQVNLLPRSEQRAYAGSLREHDVGLALMYTPHPSLVPIEMASAGMLTVTNSFENKTPAAWPRSRRT